MRARAWIAACALAPFALLLAAALLWLGETPEFGWFAYGPLPEEANLVVMTGRRDLALILGTAGLLLLAFLGGVTIGRRSRGGRTE